MIKAIVAASCLLLSGCDALNCIINNQPQFSKNNVNEATLNQVYEDSITASISNSFEDRQYNYQFIVDGELPAGINYQSSGRTITFEGTATELGEFPFTLTVTTEPGDAAFNVRGDELPGELCTDAETRAMVLSVAQET